MSSACVPWCRLASIRRIVANVNRWTSKRYENAFMRSMQSFKRTGGMGMTLIKWTPESESDLVEIWHQIATDSMSAADDVMLRIQEQSRKLAEFPLIGRMRDELRRGLRSVSAHPYVILYRIRSEAVEILRVLHGARDLKELI